MKEAGSENTSRAEILRMTADVVAAYLGNNLLPSGKIPEVISTVYGSLNGINGGPGAGRRGLSKAAVPIRKSVTPDYIICLEDGKKLKMLKRHLRTTYSMTPDEYRVKWGLSPDYPMVAPNYSAQRSTFAKKIGLGRTTKRRRAIAH